MTDMTTNSPYKILVAYMPDETGDRALAHALRLAAGHGDCELHLVHAVDEPAHLTKQAAVRKTDEHLSTAQKAVGERLERIWKESGERSVLISHVRPGGTVETILQSAIDVDADILVLGTHRRAGLEKLVLGSVAEQILKRASCPVLVAVPKDYTGLPASAKVAPPCPKCLAIRRETKNASYWCDQHSKHYHAPHVYVPRAGGRASVLSTY